MKIKKVFFCLLLIVTVLFDNKLVSGEFLTPIKTIQPILSSTWKDILEKAKSYSYSKSISNLKVKPNFLTTPKHIRLLHYRGINNLYRFTSKTLENETPYSSFKIKKNFKAILDDYTSIPSDTMGAVGNSYIMTMLNNKVKIRGSDGKSYGKAPLDYFWNGFSYEISNTTAIFDSFMKRRLTIDTADFETPNSKTLTTISKTSNPLGYWGKFYFYTDIKGISFVDNPRAGLNIKWIVIKTNMFSLNDYHCINPKLWIVNKNSFENKNSDLRYKEFPVNFDNLSGTLVPAVSFDINEPNLYIVSDYNYFDILSNQSLLQLFEITGSDYNPQLKPVFYSKSLLLGIGLFYPHIKFNIKQIKAYPKGIEKLIDTNGINIINYVFINGKLWFTHVGGLLATGKPDRVTVFRYEIHPKLLGTVGNFTIQSGVIDSGKGGCVFSPSIAVNKYNDVVIGFTRTDKQNIQKPHLFQDHIWIRMEHSNPKTMSQEQRWPCF